MANIPFLNIEGRCILRKPDKPRLFFFQQIALYHSNNKAAKLDNAASYLCVFIRECVLEYYVNSLHFGRLNTEKIGVGNENIPVTKREKSLIICNPLYMHREGASLL